MSLPHFTPQGSLFSTAALGQSLFSTEDRYRLFAKWVFPQLIKARPQLEKAYSANIGRQAVEPMALTRSWPAALAKSWPLCGG